MKVSSAFSEALDTLDIFEMEPELYRRIIMTLGVLDTRELRQAGARGVAKEDDHDIDQGRQQRKTLKGGCRGSYSKATAIMGAVGLKGRRSLNRMRMGRMRCQPQCAWGTVSRMPTSRRAKGKGHAEKLAGVGLLSF